MVVAQTVIKIENLFTVYSLFLNPVKNFFGKMKSFVKSRLILNENELLKRINVLQIQLKTVTGSVF